MRHTKHVDVLQFAHHCYITWSIWESRQYLVQRIAYMPRFKRELAAHLEYANSVHTGFWLANIRTVHYWMTVLLTSTSLIFQISDKPALVVDRPADRRQVSEPSDSKVNKATDCVKNPTWARSRLLSHLKKDFNDCGKVRLERAVGRGQMDEIFTAHCMIEGETSDKEQASQKEAIFCYEGCNVRSGQGKSAMQVRCCSVKITEASAFRV